MKYVSKSEHKRKLYCAILSVAVLLAFVSCQAQSPSLSPSPSLSASPKASSSALQKIEYHNFYELYEIKDANDKTVKYQYSILDHKGNVMDIQEWEGSMPQISLISSFLVKVTLPDGTSPIICRYYDVLRGKKSQAFEAVYDDDPMNRVVAHFVCREMDIYDVTLVVCDMFEPEAQKMEIEREFVSLLYPAECVRFLSKGKLYLEYEVFATGGVEEMLANGDYSFREVEEIVDITAVYESNNEEG